MRRATLLLGSAAFLALLPAGSCQVDPIVPLPAQGGALTGGFQSTGGTVATTGGTTSWGGAVATGGTTATTIRWLSCNDAAKVTPPVKRNLSGWKPSKDRAMRKRAKPSYRLTAESVFWQPNLATPLDQGSLGSCTGNAIAHCLSTQPFAGQAAEADAVAIYSLATRLDVFAGAYPPNDTGSSGSAAAEAAKRLGYTTAEFVVVDTIEGLQVALQRSSCVIGVNWYSGFFSPTRCGELQLTGSNDGGHEVQILGWDAQRKIFIMRNSWGPSFGVCREGDPGECGYAYWSAGTLQTLLNRGAEIDCPDL